MPSSRTSSAGANFFGLNQQPYESYFPPVVAPMAEGYQESPDAALSQIGVQANDALRKRSMDTYQQLQNFDPTDPESVTGLDRMIGLGQVSPSQGNALIRSAHYLQPKTGSSRNSPYSDEGTAFLNNFNSLDWINDPHSASSSIPALLKQYPGALSDPRVNSTISSFQKHAMNWKPQKSVSDDEFATLPTHYQAGAGKILGNLSNFGTLFGNESTAQDVAANRNGILKAVKGLQLLGISPERVSGELSIAGLDPNEWMNGRGPASSYNPTQEEKETWFKSQGIDPRKATPEQWQHAYYGAQGATPPQGQAVPQGQVPVAVQPQIPAFNTHEEAEASGVPAGTVVIIGGRRFRKD